MAIAKLVALDRNSLPISLVSSVFTQAFLTWPVKREVPIPRLPMVLFRCSSW